MIYSMWSWKLVTEKKKCCALSSTKKKSEMIMIRTCATNSKENIQPKAEHMQCFYYNNLICVLLMRTLTIYNNYGDQNTKMNPIKFVVVVVLVQRSKYLVAIRCVFITWCFMCARIHIWNLSLEQMSAFPFCCCLHSPSIQNHSFDLFPCVRQAIQYLFNPFTHLLSLLRSFSLSFGFSIHFIELYLFRSEDSVSNFSSS